MPAGSQSIVNELIRAAASIPKDITDAELDKHVADLLVKEAKEKESRFRELGIGVYLDSVRQETSAASSLPKPNKRFLSSVIRQVDGHNTALLREQALAAKEASRELLPPSSRDLERDRGKDRGSSSARPARPAGAARLLGGALGAASTSKSRQSEVERERDYRQGSSSGQRSRQEERDKSRRDRDRVDRYDSEDRDERRPRTSARFRDDRSARRRSSSRDDVRGHLRRRDRTSSDRRSRSPAVRKGTAAPAERKPEALERSDDRRTSPAPVVDDRPAPPIQSKMDRYFDEAYDPQLDFTGVLPIPSAGLVPDVGWDNMLAVLKEKGKKRRASSPGFSASPPPTTSHRRQRSISPIRTTSRSEKHRDSERSGKRKSKDKDKTKRHTRHRSRSPGSVSSGYGSEDSEARERRKRKRRKDKERRRAEEEEEDKKKFGGYVYARPGATREWDVGKVDMSF